MKAVLALVMLGAMLGLTISMVGLWIASYRIPDLPLRYRVFPMFIVEHEELWTPGMHRLKRLGMWCGAVVAAGIVGIGVLTTLFP